MLESLLRAGFVVSGAGLVLGAMAWGCQGEQLAVGVGHETGSSSAGTSGNASGGGGSGMNTGTSTTAACDGIEQQSLAIRARSCGPCHGPNSGVGDDFFNTVMDDARLVTQLSNNYAEPDGGLFRLVIPGDPTDSWLYRRFVQDVEGQHETASTIAHILGQDADVVQPTAADESIMYEWILECLGVDGRANEPDAAYGLGGDAAPIDALDATVVFGDAAPSDAAHLFPVDVTAPPPPSGQAGVALIVDGVLQKPLDCPVEGFEFWPVNAYGQPICAPTTFTCPPGTFVVLENSSAFPIAYAAQPFWTAPAPPPGVMTGESTRESGFLQPGEEVDISQVFNAGTVALVGSVQPFADLDARYLSDVGSVPWPGGVPGSGGASQMQIAEIEIHPVCATPARVW
jgi:hypothetical protein